MKIKIIAGLILLFGCVQSFAQTSKLHLIILDTKKEPVQNATVALYQLPDTILKNKKLVNGNAYFNVQWNTNYVLKISATGMQEILTAVSIPDSAISLSVEMSNKINSLGNVTVISKRALIKQEDDKTIVDAEPLANSSTNAYEVLEKTPGAIVDQDGNVYLNSAIPATIFINGREMKLSSTDIASLLKSLPAGSVSKIEILRTPSAKYDAASSGGIVNIVLKKGVKLGTNGTLNAGYFQGVYATETAGININKGSGKINSYLSYQFTNRNNYETLNSDRRIKTDTSLLAQRSYTTYPSKNNYLSAGIDMAFTQKFNVGYDLRISNTDGKSDAINENDISNDETHLLIGKSESDINNRNRSVYIGNTVSGKYKIDSTGSEWTAQLEYNYYKNNNTQLYKNYSFLPSKLTESVDGENRNNKNIFVFQTDLTYKFPKKYTLETGFKATFSNSDNSAVYFKDTGNSIRFADVYQTNTFKYKETICAAYLQVSKTFAGFTIKPGLRLETTDINGQQFIPKDTTLSIKRTDVFPYLFIRHRLFRIFGFPSFLVGNAIYRRSIKRPYYEILNPYPKYVDRYLFDVGNPALKPQFTTNYEINVTYDDIPVLAAGINDTKDIFSNVTYQDNITKIAYRTYDNLGKSKEFYLRAVGGIPPGGKYFFYLGGQYNYNRYSGFYQGQPLNYNHGSWVFFVFQEYRATEKLTLNMQGFMRTKGLLNLYELNTFGGLYVSVNKSILKKKANIILSVNDLLQTNHVSFSLKQGSVNAAGSRVNDTRRIGLTFRYNFGIKPKEEKKNTFDAPAEAN
ncbi:MAG: outer membrane beta-barrel protein [Ferruginibacter sp.]